MQTFRISSVPTGFHLYHQKNRIFSSKPVIPSRIIYAISNPFSVSGIININRKSSTISRIDWFNQNTMYIPPGTNQQHQVNHIHRIPSLAIVLITSNNDLYSNYHHEPINAIRTSSTVYPQGGPIIASNNYLYCWVPNYFLLYQCRKACKSVTVSKLTTIV